MNPTGSHVVTLPNVIILPPLLKTWRWRQHVCLNIGNQWVYTVTQPRSKNVNCMACYRIHSKVVKLIKHQQFSVKCQAALTIMGEYLVTLLLFSWCPIPYLITQIILYPLSGLKHFGGHFLSSSSIKRPLNKASSRLLRHPTKYYFTHGFLSLNLQLIPNMDINHSHTHTHTWLFYATHTIKINQIPIFSNAYHRSNYITPVTVLTAKHAELSLGIMYWICVRFQFLTGANITIRAFCDIALCSLGVHWHFRGVHCLHPSGRKIIALMIEAVRISETLVYSNETTQHYIPEGSNFYTDYVFSNLSYCQCVGQKI
jgi:hypothetical protein